MAQWTAWKEWSMIGASVYRKVMKAYKQEIPAAYKRYTFTLFPIFCMLLCLKKSTLELRIRWNTMKAIGRLQAQRLGSDSSEAIHHLAQKFQFLFGEEMPHSGPGRPQWTAFCELMCNPVFVSACQCWPFRPVYFALPFIPLSNKKKFLFTLFPLYVARFSYIYVALSHIFFTIYVVFHTV